MAVLLLFLAAGVVAAQSVPPRKDIPAIAKAANGAIVSIIMSDKDGHAIAQGTGFLISKDGRIVTNYHVIENGSSAIVKLPDGTFFLVDGVLASDKARDVAVIKAHGENFRTLTLGNSDRLQVGEEVVAIGNPLSLESTVSSGIVSGIRTIEEEGGKFLQVTTPISPGSSGGPLFNMAGEVVGITTLYLKGGENLNFAIPINDVKPMLQTGYSKLINFPDEPKIKDDAKREKDTGKHYVEHSGTAREYYRQLYDSGAFAKLIGKYCVCFNDDNKTREFFVFTAERYNQEYSDAAAEVFKITQGEKVSDSKNVQIRHTFERIQRTAPYADFDLARDQAGWSLVFPDPRFRSGILIQDVYTKGVKDFAVLWGWDENSDSWVTHLPDTSGSSVTNDWTGRLSIEPSTLRYIETHTVITTVGTGETKVVVSKTYEHSGACESLFK